MTTPPNQRLREGIARTLAWSRRLVGTPNEADYLDADAILDALPGMIDEEMVERAAKAWDHDWLHGPPEQDQRSAMRAALRAAFGGEGKA